MASTGAMLHQKPQKMQQPEHNIELMCRLCAADFKIATEGVPIFNTEQLMDKIKNYLQIQVNNSDKLSHLVCNECVMKIENFHLYAKMAQKNQELFNIMYSEKIYREHCTALSSLNTTLYREPPQIPGQSSTSNQPHTITVQQVPPIKKQKIQTQQKPIKVQPQTSVHPKTNHQQQPVPVLSTEDITIFTYQDLKLGQVIKDQELQKLILRALKWTDGGKTIEEQLERLRNASFRGVLNNPDLLRDEDLVQLLGPYLHQPNPPEPAKSSGMDYNAKLMDDSVTEMEVGVDPDLFFPYDDDDTKSVDIEVSRVVMKPKKERKKSESRRQTANKRAAAAAAASAAAMQMTTITAIPNLLPAVSIVPQISTPVQSVITSTSTSTTTIPAGKIRVKPESQLFNTTSNIAQSTTIGQTTIMPENMTIPKPIIVIPSVHTKPKQITPTKRKTLDERPSLQIIPEPIITTTAATTTTTTTAQSIQPIITVPTTSPAKSTIDTNKTAAKNAKAKLEAANTMASLSAGNITTPVVSTPPAATRTKSKKDTKLRNQIRIKLDTGPKTRARSIFSAKHKCGVCGKKFTTSGNLKAHVKTHKPKGKFNCDKCGRVFKTQANLQRHKEYHAGERFSCRTCGRVYPSNSTLKQHEISHSNFRPHKCNICMKTFKRGQDLKFHTNQHTGEKPYKCPFCSKAFASSGNCFSHRKRVHSDKNPSDPVPTITTTSNTSSRKNASADSTSASSKKLVKA